MLTMTASARDLIPPPVPPNPPEEWYKEREESSPVIPPGVTPFPYTDCNHNGVADRSESFPDCDSNGIVDWCQIEADPSLDCDEDGLLDACLMSVNLGFDCNSNGIFDLCEPQFQLPDYPLDPPQGALPDDCNANRISDELEICRNQLIDCNGDGLLDLCQILADPSLDCDEDGVLDFCEINSRTDCDGNGILDRCENPCDIGLGGPNYLGDGDWGRWTWIEESGCTVVVTVLSGPIQIVDAGAGCVDVQAYPMSPGDEQPAMLRAVKTCGDDCSDGSECFIDVALTVQAYAVLKVEARAFIPCGAAGLVEADLASFSNAVILYEALHLLFGKVGRGDCRSFDSSTPLPTNGTAPSSRVVTGIQFSMRFLSTPSTWSAMTDTQMSSQFTAAIPPDWSECEGVLVPVTDDSNNCDLVATFWNPPCPAPPGYSPPTPMFADRSVSGAALGLGYVGASRYKKIDLDIEESNTCYRSVSPGITLDGELGLWQRCDPATGMMPVWYDLLGAHDKFPAYEIVVQRVSGEFQAPIDLYHCPPLSGLWALFQTFFPQAKFDQRLRPQLGPPLNEPLSAHSIYYVNLFPAAPWRILP